MTPEAGRSEEETYEAPAILAEDVILFPEMEVNISVHDPRSVAATAQAFREHNLLVLIPSPSLNEAVGSIGTLVLLRRAVAAEGSGAQSLWKGLWRVKVDSVVGSDPYLRVRFSKASAGDDVSSGESSLMKAVFDQIDEFVRVIPGVPTEIATFLKGVDRPGKLADLCAYSPFFSRQERLDLLRTLDPEARLRKVSGLFEKQLASLQRFSETKTILDCPVCIELADKAFELGPSGAAKAAREFLDHVTREHPDELLGLIAEHYGPAFMRRRALK
ncbi:MAG TPA: LON peptidase substrate-binding domain-containing protein [Nitrososphaerales archaeon]|nr:LON peptidase substrate-binding domain-containing protein [Nitrososphaerales archaeon]